MVIQRWQSVLLLIAAAMMCCFTFISLGQVAGPFETLNFTTLGFEKEGIPTDGATGGFESRTWILFIISLLSAILPFIDIFLFKNLRLQKQLCMIELLFILTTVCIAIIYACFQYPDMNVSWWSMLLPSGIAFIAVVLAANRISHDRNLLLSADRIR